MGRHGYQDDLEPWDIIRWRGQVASAVRGKRGQAFLKELLQALDEMSEKRLITKELRSKGEVCTLGAVGAKRGIDLESLDPREYETIADRLDIAHQLVQEIEWKNDEIAMDQTPEERWVRMRRWVAEQIKVTDPVPVDMA